MVSYIQSTEEYKGYTIEIEMYRFLGSKNLQYHRRVNVYKDGERISVGKTKKEMKELIDGGYIERFRG